MAAADAADSIADAYFRVLALREIDAAIRTVARIADGRSASYAYLAIFQAQTDADAGPGDVQ
jgi:hypothetical protein